MIVAFHSPKAGVGTTTLAALFCILAREFDIPVAGVASPESPDLDPWLHPAGIPHLAPEAAQADADLELLVLDVPSRSTPTMKPDVWVIPIVDSRTLARTVELSASLAGEIVWIGNRRQVTRGDIPDPLRPRVHVAPSVRSSHSIAAATAGHRIPWSDPTLSRSPGAVVLRDSLEWLLDHLCEPGDHTLARRGAPQPPSRPRPRRYPIRVLDEYHPDPARDVARLREFCSLPGPDAPRDPAVH